MQIIYFNLWGKNHDPKHSSKKCSQDNCQYIYKYMYIIISLHRIPPGQSYFDQPPTCWDTTTLPVYFCQCAEENPADFEGEIPDRVTCVHEDGVVIPQTTGHVCVNDKRKRRDLREIIESGHGDDVIGDDELYYKFKYDPEAGSDVDPTWPTASGKTEAMVESRCRQALEASPAYSACKDWTDVEEIVNECKFDTQVIYFSAM